MKNISRMIIMFVIMIVCSSKVFAAPVGNIASPAMVKNTGKLVEFMTGVEVDMVFDRNVKDFDDTELNFYMAKLGLAVSNKALFYALLGTGEGKVEYTILGTKVKYETGKAFAWGVGATVILYETEVSGYGNGILRLGGDLKYRHAKPYIERVIIGSKSYELSSFGLTENVIEYGEFQGAIGASYQIDKFIPYMGVKFTSLSGTAKSTLNGTEYKNDYEADSVVGMFLGADLKLTDTIVFNVEGRFIDEEAVNVGATIRF